MKRLLFLLVCMGGVMLNASAQDQVFELTYTAEDESVYYLKQSP